MATERKLVPLSVAEIASMRRDAYIAKYGGITVQEAFMARVVAGALAERGLGNVNIFVRQAENSAEGSLEILLSTQNVPGQMPETTIDRFNSVFEPLLAKEKMDYSPDGIRRAIESRLIGLKEQENIQEL